MLTCPFLNILFCAGFKQPPDPAFEKQTSQDHNLMFSENEAYNTTSQVILIANASKTDIKPEVIYESVK